MYKVDNISKVFWKIAKSSFDTDEVIERLKQELCIYTGCDEEHYTTKVVCDLAISAFSDFCQSDACSKVNVEYFFNQVRPDTTLFSLLNIEQPNYSLDEKIIFGVLSALRYVKVKEKVEETYITLVDFE